MKKNPHINIVASIPVDEKEYEKLPKEVRDFMEMIASKDDTHVQYWFTDDKAEFEFGH